MNDPSSLDTFEYFLIDVLTGFLSRSYLIYGGVVISSCDKLLFDGLLVLIFRVGPFFFFFLVKRLLFELLTEIYSDIFSNALSSRR